MTFTSLIIANKAATALFRTGRAPSMWRERSFRSFGSYVYFVDANSEPADQPAQPQPAQLKQQL
jgi:hypothetical protein